MQKIGFLFVILLAVQSLLPQSGGSFSINKSVIANGGGASSGGAFGVTSTIAQPLAHQRK